MALWKPVPDKPGPPGHRPPGQTASGLEEDGPGEVEDAPSQTRRGRKIFENGL